MIVIDWEEVVNEEIALFHKMLKIDLFWDKESRMEPLGEQKCGFQKSDFFLFALKFGFQKSDFFYLPSNWLRSFNEADDKLFMETLHYMPIHFFFLFQSFPLFD